MSRVGITRVKDLEVDKNLRKIDAFLTGFDILSNGQAKLKPLQGAYLKDISLSNASTEIAHNLGYKLTGYLVVNQNAASTFFNSTPDDREYDYKNKFALTASASVAVDLWVF